MFSEPHIVSIQVGLPQTHGQEEAADPLDRPWTTGFFKSPVQGAVWLGATNLAGDGQADLSAHGGPDKAVLAYAEEHYPFWREELAQTDLPYGAFGENFTIAGTQESDVCLGDIYETDQALVQVSQPRQPCWKLSRRWRRKELTKQAWQNGRLGWYLRVLREGNVEAGDVFALRERPFPQWTIARLLEIRRAPSEHIDAVRELVSCPLLATSWREELSTVLQ